MGGAPPTPARAPGRAARLRRKALISAAASVLILGIAGVLGTALLVRGRTSLGGGEGGPVVASAPEPPVPAAPLPEARGRPGLGLFGAIRALAAALRRIDLPALVPPGKTGETAAVAEGHGVCEIAVLDEDGKLVRTGQIQILRVLDAIAEGEVSPGAATEAAGLKKRLLSRSLAESNPTELGLQPELLGARLLLRVLADGYPPLERPGIELGPATTRIALTLRSRRATTVRLLDAGTGEPARGARVRLVPARGEDGRGRKGDAIAGREEEPGLHVLRGLDGGRYDLAVSSSRLVPVLKEDIEPAAEEVLWVHEAEEERTGAIAVSVFRPDGSPWAGTEVVARVDGAVLTRRTDEEGRCRFEDLPEGNQTFLLPLETIPETPAIFLAERTILVRPGLERRVALGAPPVAEALAVEVVDPRGGPFPGILVRLEGTRYFVGRTGEDGRAVFESVPAGEYMLGLLRPGASPWVLHEPIQVRPGERNELRTTFGTATIRGRVASAVPAGLHVLARRTDRRTALEVGEDGAFEIRGAPPGKVLLSTVVDTQSSVCRRAVEVEVPEGGDPAAVEIRLEGLGILWVEVAGVDGRPVPGTWVTIAGRQGDLELERRSTGLMAAELAGLGEPGTRRILVSAPGRTAVERRVAVRAGEEGRVQVVLHE